MLDVRRLRILVAVAEEGSFTAAAQRLYMTQSAVSQQMSGFEREIGIPLLERLPRGVKLTPAGNLLVTRAHGLFGEISSIEHELQQFGSVAREIRLGAFLTAGVEMLPQAMKTFILRCPDVQVVTSSIQGTNPITPLLDGDIHVLLMWDFDFDPRPWDAAVTQIHLPVDPLEVLLPATHPLAYKPEVALTDFANDPWIVRSHRAPYEQAYQKIFRLAGIEPNIVFTTEDYQSMQGLVAAGIGISLAPRLSITPHRDDVITRSLSGQTFARRVTILALPETIGTTPVSDLIEVLRETAIATAKSDS